MITARSLPHCGHRLVHHVHNDDRHWLTPWRPRTLLACPTCQIKVRAYVHAPRRTIQRLRWTERIVNSRQSS